MLSIEFNSISIKRNTRLQKKEYKKSVVANWLLLEYYYDVR